MDGTSVFWEVFRNEFEKLSERQPVRTFEPLQ